MKRALIVPLMTLALCLLLTGVAFAQEANPQSSPTQAGEIAALLTPLVAAATAIERMIEFFFDWFEGTVQSASKFPAQASDYLSWARKQLEKSQQELLNPNASLAQLKAAEDNLLKAKDRLNAYLSNPPYTTWKRKISLALGIALGLIIAFVARLQMFSLLGIPMPGNLLYVDIFITGLVIGTGSAPVHSLIGIIQNTRDAIDGARALWKGKATAEVKEMVSLFAQLQAAPPREALRGAAPTAPEPMSQAELERMVQRLLK